MTTESRMSARVLLGKNVLFERVDIRIIESVPREGQSSWKGVFLIPIDSEEAAAFSLYEEDGPFTLVMDDGRRGNFIFSGENECLTGTYFEFKGTGPLTVP